MIISITLTLLILACSFIYAGSLVDNAEISIAPIIGIVVGALYSYQEFEEETEYTLQCCIFVISLTVVWTQSANG